MYIITYVKLILSASPVANNGILFNVTIQANSWNDFINRFLD